MLFTNEAQYVDLAGGQPYHEVTRQRLHDCTASPDRYAETYVYYDGLGRKIQARASGDTIGGNVIVSDVAYDKLGRVVRSAVPYAAAGSSYQAPTWASGDTKTAYDPLGRTTLVTLPDQTKTATFYKRYETAVIDASTNGSLLPQFSEIYQYNTIGNLINRNGQSYTYPDAGQPRPHAVTAVGDDTYAYDDNGNMTIRVVPRQADTAAWTWGLSLTGYGYGAQLQPIMADETLPEIQVDGNRVEYHYPQSIVEWYVNDERGLEQGFTLAARPAQGRNQGRDLVLEMALSGDLQARQVNEGELVFTNPAGRTVLRYGHLTVFDATGRVLPARLALTAGTIRVIIADAGAVYPLTIDPLVTSPSWFVESNQDGASLGWTVASAGNVNGDGYDDIIVGAPRYNDEGAVFVWYGSSSALGTGGTPANADWMAESNQTDANFGWAVASAGNVNGDDYDDIIVGAPGDPFAIN